MNVRTGNKTETEAAQSERYNNGSKS